jgi:AAA+ ATPase superfamily predicted ATPase
VIVYENTIEPDLPNHVGETFEDICQEAIWERIRRKEFQEYSEIDRWWYGENKIDIVGLSPTDDTILFAECKWTADPVGRGPVDDLQPKTDHVQWGSADRTERFALFSKSGFVDGLELCCGR